MTTLGHFRTPLLQTPFHPRTAAANVLSRWGPWGGYMAALCFGDVDMEYTAIRNAASVYDLCPMVKYRIAGRDAAAYLNRLTLRNAATLPVGAVHYTAWCDDDGKLLDDCTLFRNGPDDFLICCQERHLPWLLDSAEGFDVQVAEVTQDIAALSLQGPCSASVLAAAGFDVEALKPFRMARFAFAAGEVTISRTGFTGDLGYELWIDPALALPLWDRLMTAGAPWGIRPIGSDALNLARIEAGFIITNLDFVPAHQALREDRPRSPLEMGLGWMIDWDKGHFTGRQALLAEKQAGSAWALVGLDIPGNVSAEGSILYHDKRTEAGFVTAAAWSPALKASIALAQVKARNLPGGNLWVEIYALRELQYVKLMLPVTVVERPFFNPPRRRATPAGRV
ncbi:aminomethyltransferase family protein [Rhodobacter sp. Har01]|uniref:aminomethyltransferase family protein n=1 Tax=Rhodobacter sp. Har01 TaxID=2883999 RepID=UPI001D062BAF|nr:aminomethyltransferase family protein [Rhodobacter sp. Har01]MCB6178550.1 aminomethyltransferase family protein [Rhodobacter sp. Har01]